MNGDQEGDRYLVGALAGYSAFCKSRRLDQPSADTWFVRLSKEKKVREVSDKPRRYSLVA
jgi:hypothetical protein